MNQRIANSIVFLVLFTILGCKATDAENTVDPSENWDKAVGSTYNLLYLQDDYTGNKIVPTRKSQIEIVSANYVSGSLFCHNFLADQVYIDSTGSMNMGNIVWSEQVPNCFQNHKLPSNTNLLFSMEGQRLTISSFNEYWTMIFEKARTQNQ